MFLNAEISFADIDECKRDFDDCGEHRICNNTHGGYECLCRRGYDDDNNGNCIGKLEIMDHSNRQLFYNPQILMSVNMTPMSVGATVHVSILREAIAVCVILDIRKITTAVA